MMARLSHLNGASGVGKSTLARAFAAENSGTLALDADRIVAMIGGWRDDFLAALPIARALAAEMTYVHLKNGYDVVMPQLVTDSAESLPYRRAVEAAHGVYVEVVLRADVDTTIERFYDRARSTGDAVDVVLERLIDGWSGPRLIPKITDDLARYLVDRDPIVIDTQDLSVQQILQQLIRRPQRVIQRTQTVDGGTDNTAPSRDGIRPTGPAPGPSRWLAISHRRPSPHVRRPGCGSSTVGRVAQPPNAIRPRDQGCSCSSAAARRCSRAEWAVQPGLRRAFDPLASR